MCLKASEWMPSSPPCSLVRQRRSRRSKVRVCRLTRKRRSGEVVTIEGTDEMELKNLKLYLENRSIIEENEKLKKKALLLHQENLALMSEFQKRFSHLDVHHN